MNIDIVVYNPAHKTIWDSFVSSSKNGTFLFYRDYMEYHQDRFSDHSLLFFLKGKLIALLPAHRVDDKLYSHQGLTYGGLITSSYIKINHVVSIFDAILSHLNSLELRSLSYKTIPYIYNKEPSEEDLYALFLHKAVLQNRAVSSCLYLDKTPLFSTLRRRLIRKSFNYDLSISEDTRFDLFWNILEINLETRYGNLPTHTLSEITSLKNSFPDNIKLYTVSINSIIIGGCVIFFSEKVAHIQYIASNDVAKDIGAIDYLFSEIIILLYNKGVCLDFGTSMLEDHFSLNKSLVFQKEGFGARTIVYDTYLVTSLN